MKGNDPLAKRSWKYTANRALGEFSRDGCADLAAGLTYNAVLAIFPALLALVSLLGVFGQGKQTTDALVKLLNEVGAGTVAEPLRGVIAQMTETRAAGFALVIGIGGALWSASAYVGAFSRAMNRIYGVSEGRPFWRLRPMQLMVTIAAVLGAAIVLISLVISGPIAAKVGGWVGLGTQAVTIWNIAKWPGILIVVVLMVALLYYATPNVWPPTFRWVSIGAVIAIIVWVLATAGFGFYVANFSKYNATYGSLGGVIVFLLWIYLTNMALLLGAEIDTEIQRTRQLREGLPAEEHLLLRPRDTRAFDKETAKYDQQVEQGRQLRLEADRRTTAAERASGYLAPPRTGDSARARRVRQTILTGSQPLRQSECDPSQQRQASHPAVGGSASRRRQLPRLLSWLVTTVLPAALLRALLRQRADTHTTSRTPTH